MAFTAHQLVPKMRAITAAAHPYCTAVALSGLPAANVSFQWHSPSYPPTQNVNSAPRSLTSARHFSGIMQFMQ